MNSRTDLICGSVISIKRENLPGPVDLGGLVELLGDRLESGQYCDHHEGKSFHVPIMMVVTMAFGMRVSQGMGLSVTPQVISVASTTP